MADVTDTPSTRPQMGDEELREILAQEYERERMPGWAADVRAGKFGRTSPDRHLKIALAAMSRLRTSLPQATAGSTEAIKMAICVLAALHQDEVYTKLHSNMRVDVKMALDGLRALSSASTPAQSVLVEDDYVLLPKTLTVEIACALEMAAPPPATSQAAAEQLVADYAMIWSHVVALSHAPSQSQPKRASEIAYARKCWTDEIKNSCRDRCGEFGEPACFEIVEWATPCLDCSPRASQPERMSMVGAIPDGWKLVPAEPTEEMFEAAHHAIAANSGDVCDVYRAMLAASPPIQPIAGEE